MKLLRPLAGYTLYDHKTNDYVRCELRITGILDKIDEYRRNWLSHLQRMPQNRITLNYTNTDHKEGEKLEDQRSVGASSCNSGDGTDQRVQSLKIIMMMALLFIWWVYDSASCRTQVLSSWQDKVESECCTWRYAFKMYGQSEFNFNAFLISVPKKGEWPAQQFGHFILREGALSTLQTDYRWTSELAKMWRKEKIK